MIFCLLFLIAAIAGLIFWIGDNSMHQKPFNDSTPTDEKYNRFEELRKEHYKGNHRGNPPLGHL